MKKKHKILIVVCVAVLVLAVGITALIFANTVRLGSVESGQLYLLYSDQPVEAELSREDVAALCKILNGEMPVSEAIGGIPACGCSEKTRLCLNGKETYVFWLPSDTCGNLYFQNADGYISLSNSENQALREILGQYGLITP